MSDLYPERALALTERARRRRVSAAPTFAPGLSGRAFEIAPVFGGCGAAGVVGGVVVVEFALSLHRDHPKDAQV